MIVTLQAALSPFRILSQNRSGFAQPGTRFGDWQDLQTTLLPQRLAKAALGPRLLVLALFLAAGLLMVLTECLTRPLAPGLGLLPLLQRARASAGPSTIPRTRCEAGCHDLSDPE